MIIIIKSIVPLEPMGDGFQEKQGMKSWWVCAHDSNATLINSTRPTEALPYSYSLQMNIFLQLINCASVCSMNAWLQWTAFRMFRTLMQNAECRW